MDHAEFDELECKVTKLNSSMVLIKEIRNGYIAHRNAGMTVEEIFNKYEIIPDKIRDVILETTEIINTMAREQGMVNVIFESERSSRSALLLLETMGGIEERNKDTKKLK